MIHHPLRLVFPACQPPRAWWPSPFFPQWTALVQDSLDIITMAAVATIEQLTVEYSKSAEELDQMNTNLRHARDWNVRRAVSPVLCDGQEV